MRAEEAAVRAEILADFARMEATAEQLQAQVTELRRERDQRAERDRAENSVLQALAPVRQSLHDMQAKVAELEAQRQQQHGELSQQLRAAAQSEEHLRQTADSLAAALSNNAMRGVWERRSCAASSRPRAARARRLRGPVEHHVRRRRGRPDMVIRLPGGKSIAVDSKVPFNSYLEASAIPATANGEERRGGWRCSRRTSRRCAITSRLSATSPTGTDSMRAP
ncbi:RmuC family protein, partial [Paramicrobacterium humi]